MISFLLVIGQHRSVGSTLNGGIQGALQEILVL